MRKPTELHGDSGSPEYKAWRGMSIRCARSDYASRGITVCQEWRLSYIAFRAHVGKRPANKYSLDRIDNDGNYEPGNVRWATAQEQQRNTRQNVPVSLHGTSRTIAEWAETLGLKYATIRGRLLRGHSPEHALHVGRFKSAPRSRNGKPFKGAANVA